MLAVNDEKTLKSHVVLVNWHSFDADDVYEVHAIYNATPIRQHEFLAVFQNCYHFF